MSRAPQSVRIGYFGKIPARADFIKASDNPALVSLLDEWLAGVMNRLTADPRWKLNYDALKPLHFAFVGTRSHRAVAGHIAASSDESQRRYPFLAMSSLTVEEPDAFLPLSPVILSWLWQEQEQLAQAVLEAEEPTAALQMLSDGVVEVEPGSGSYVHAFDDFLEHQSLSGLEALLGRAPVRRLILALGLLLEPVRDSGAARLEHSLVLPLPQAPRYRFLVATFWLDLIAPFLSCADFELSLFLAEQNERQVLVIGFDGAEPETLLSIVDPLQASERQITLDHTDWVDAQIAGDAGSQKLSACLEQGQLSLLSARALFHEAFS